MKKNFYLAALMIPAILVTSCDKPQHRFAIKVTSSPNEGLISLTSAGVKKLIDTKQTFPLLLYSDTCSYCEIAQEYIANYRKSNPITIYKISAVEFIHLMEEMPGYFEGEIYAPNMYIFDKGVLTYTFGSDKLTSNASFVAEANSVFLKSNMEFLPNNFDISSKLKEHPNTMVFVNDIEDDESLKFYSESFFDAAANSDKYSLILDFNLGNPNFNEDDQHKIIVYENGKEKERLDYVTDSLSCVDYINSYFLQ